MDTAVVLVSGGVNSLVAAGVAAKEYNLAMMHVSYGQRTADRELACFRQICDVFKPVKHLVVPLPHFETVGGNARVDKRVTVEDARTLGESPANTYVVGLTPTLLALAYNWGSAIKAKRVFVGSSENDGPPLANTKVAFPDHRRELFHLYNQLVEMTARRDAQIRVETPLIDMTRGEVVRLGQHLNVPFSATWSCDRSGDAPCATCYGCVSRSQGFVDAAVTDPIMIPED